MSEFADAATALHRGHGSQHSQSLERRFDVLGLVLRQRVTIALLITAGHQRVERQRISIRGRFGLFDQHAQDPAVDGLDRLPARLMRCVAGGGVIACHGCGFSANALGSVVRRATGFERQPRSEPMIGRKWLWHAGREASRDIATLANSSATLSRANRGVKFVAASTAEVANRPPCRAPLYKEFAMKKSIAITSALLVLVGLSYAWAPQKKRKSTTICYRTASISP